MAEPQWCKAKCCDHDVACSAPTMVDPLNPQDPRTITWQISTNEVELVGEFLNTHLGCELSWVPH